MTHNSKRQIRERHSRERHSRERDSEERDKQREKEKKTFYSVAKVCRKSAAQKVKQQRERETRNSEKHVL